MITISILVKKSAILSLVSPSTYFDSFMSRFRSAIWLQTPQGSSGTPYLALPYHCQPFLPAVPISSSLVLWHHTRPAFKFSIVMLYLATIPDPLHSIIIVCTVRFLRGLAASTQQKNCCLVLLQQLLRNTSNLCSVVLPRSDDWTAGQSVDQRAGGLVQGWKELLLEKGLKDSRSVFKIEQSAARWRLIELLRLWENGWRDVLCLRDFGMAVGLQYGIYHVCTWPDRGLENVSSYRTNISKEELQSAENMSDGIGEWVKAWFQDMDA